MPRAKRRPAASAAEAPSTKTNGRSAGVPSSGVQNGDQRLEDGEARVTPGQGVPHDAVAVGLDLLRVHATMVLAKHPPRWFALGECI